MRTSRNTQQNQHRIKQFRGRVGQRLIGKTKLKASSKRRYFNGVSPLNRGNVEDTQPSYTQYQSRGARQKKLFQQRGIQFSQNQTTKRSFSQKQQTRGQGWNVGVRPSYGTSYGNVAQRQGKQDTSFHTVPVVRGRLKSNFGYMRSDTISQKQHLKQELQMIQLQQQQQQLLQQQQQQQHWVQKSWLQLKTKLPLQMQNSARTAIYEPSSNATVTIQIPNTVDRSSGVSVIFGKKSKRKRQNDTFARSVALQQPDGTNQLGSMQFGSQNQSAVSFEDDVDVETEHSSSVNGLPIHLVSRGPAASSEDVDCSVLIV